MGLINPTMPVVGQDHATEDPKTRNALIAIRNEINGNLDAANVEAGAVIASKLSDALAKVLGVDNGVVDGRGFAEVATSQTYGSTSYGDLATVGPTVSIDVPSNGFVLAYIEASMTPTATGAALIGLYEATDFATPITLLTRAANAGVATLVTEPGGQGVQKSVAVGGFVVIPATAGKRTYTLKYARFGGSGSVTYASRKLWVIGGGPA
jgi:hypothetical protein